MWMLGLLLPVLLLMQGQGSWGACVEVESNTEARANQVFKLGCICCKMRAEVPAIAEVEWLFMPFNKTTFHQIYIYRGKEEIFFDEQFRNRLEWDGSKGTDLQDGSINILNVAYNDAGTYRCFIHRSLNFLKHPKYDTHSNKTFNLTVVPELTRPDASIVSEVMMYVSIIGLQLWLLVEMIYCYGKISSASSIDEATRESTEDYIATSLTKKNSEDFQVTE